MSEDSLVLTEGKSVGWYEIVIPVRGCQISLENIKSVYRELLEINRAFGGQTIAKLPRNEDMSDAQWDSHKAMLLNNAFSLTTKVNGQRDLQLYGEAVDVFDDPNLPKPIKSIFFTNKNSFARHANGDQPLNQITVNLDFSKPKLFDPHHLVSAETPNDGIVTISAQDITFFNAAQKAVEKNLTSNHTWYGAIHRNFVYDAGLWFLALPLSLYVSAYYMDQVIPVESNFALFRWPLFIYFVGLAVIFYRGITSYAKWAFPVNILVENKDAALRHRLALGAIVTWCFGTIANSIYDLFF